MNRGYDKWIIFLVLVLIVFGLLAVYSSTSVISPDTVEKYRKKGVEFNQFIFLKKQLTTVALGTILMFAACKMPLAYLKRFAIPLLILSLGAVLLVFSPLGVSAGGARRWLRLWPSTFQPSELVKLAMVIFLAWYLSRPAFKREKFVYFLIPIGIMGAFQAVFLKQPDFGAVMSLALLVFTMLFVSGIRAKYLLSIGVVAIPVVIMLINEPYRLKRISAFIDPWKDPQGSGFHIIQSFIALGSGGVTGMGLGESKQKLHFLPEVHTDFIFSLIGEELGFVGAAFVIFLFLLLFLRGMRIANSIKDLFPYYLVYGLSVMIALQALINFAVATGMVPTKGLPLPFISYGGSSLIVNMIAAGLLLNASRLRGQEVPADKGVDAEQLAAAFTSPALQELSEPCYSQWQRGFGYCRYGKGLAAKHETRGKT